MQSGSHYIALFFVIAVGVASGNLLSTELTARYVAYQLNAKTEQLRLEQKARQLERFERKQRNDALAREIAEAERIERLEKQERTREELKNSAFGRKLAKRCEDWKRNHTILNTETTAAESKRHCNNYEDYIN